MCVTASFADNEINPENKPAEEEMGEPMDWYDEESEFEALFSVTGDDILSSAMRYIGTPYRMGSTGPSSFDCSGFTSYVFREFGYDLPHNSQAQFKGSRPVDGFGDLRKGDLVFFGARGSIRNVGHVGIVVDVDLEHGSFRFIHASTSNGVEIQRSTQPYFMMRYMGAGRILPD